MASDAAMKMAMKMACGKRGGDEDGVWQVMRR